MAVAVTALALLTGCPQPTATHLPVATTRAVETPPPEVGSPPVSGVFTSTTPLAKLEGEALRKARLPRAAVLEECRRTAVVPLTTQPATQPQKDPPPQAVKLYLRAREKFLEGARSESMELLREALTLDPNAFTVLRLLGRVCFANGQLANGSIHLQRAHQLHPQDVEVNYFLGRYFMERKEWNTAVAYLAAADASPERQSQSPLEALTSFELARAMHQAGYYAAAAQQYEAFLPLVAVPAASYRFERELALLIEERAAVQLTVAEDYAALGEYAQAIPHYQAAARGLPRSEYILARLAVAQTRAGAADAVKSALKLVTLSNASEPAVSLLVWVYEQSGRQGSILDDLNRRATRPDGAPAVLALAGVYEKAGKKPEALAAMKRYLALQPGDIGAVERLVRLARDLNQPAEAFSAIAESMATRGDDITDLGRTFFDLVGDAAKPDLVRRLESRLADGSPAVRSRASYLLGLVAERAYEQGRAELFLSDAVKLDPSFWPAREAYVLTLLQGDNFTKARAVVEKGLEENPARVKAYTLRVESEALQGRYASALKLSLDAKQRFPDSPEVRLQLASVYRLREQYDLASRELRELMEKFPRNEEAYQRAIEQALGQRDPDTALGTLARLMRELPESRFGLTLTAQLYARAGRGDDAEQVLRRLVAEKPADVEAIIALAGVLRDVHKDEEALKTLADANARKASPALTRAVASLLRSLNRPADALKLTEKQWREHPESESWLGVYVGELLEQKQRDQAEAVLKQAVEKFPRSVAVVNSYARLLSEESKPTPAIAALEKFQQLNGASAERYYQLAHLYNEAGAGDKSTQALEKVLQINPDHTGANNDLGYFWSDKGQHLTRAEALIRKALENLPNNPAFVDSLGWIYYKQGRFAEAVEQLQRSVSLPGGKDPEVLSHLGDALYRVGRRDEAVSYWRDALNMLNNATRRLSPDKLKTKTLLTKQLEQVNNNRPVDLAPVVAATTSTAPKP